MGVNTCLWAELEHKQWSGKGCSQNINANSFACEFWVKRVGAFGVVPYHSQWPINCNVHFAELHIGSSIRYDFTLF